jgi:hypothetical protein
MKRRVLLSGLGAIVAMAAPAHAQAPDSIGGATVCQSRFGALSRSDALRVPARRRGNRVFRGRIEDRRTHSGHTQSGSETGAIGSRTVTRTASTSDTSTQHLPLVDVAIPEWKGDALQIQHASDCAVHDVNCVH